MYRQTDKKNFGKFKFLWEFFWEVYLSTSGKCRMSEYIVTVNVDDCMPDSFIHE